MRSIVPVIVAAAMLLITVQTADSYDKQQLLDGTRVGGIISGNVTWCLADSPYWIESDTTIPNMSSLTIEEGVSVLVNGSHSIVSYGNLTILGTKANPVSVMPNRTGVSMYEVITVQGGRFSANGLRINNGTMYIVNVTDSKLEDVVIEGPPDLLTLGIQRVVNLTASGITVIHSGGSNAVEMNGTGLVLRGFDISGGIAAGISFDACQRCLITDGHIQSIISTGIILQGEESKISGTRVTGSSVGLDLRGNANILESNVLVGQTGAGISLDGSGNFIANNTIQSPSIDGIYLSGGSSSPTSDNLIMGNRVNKAGRAGIISVIGLASPDSNVIAYNTIESSMMGISIESSSNNVYGNIFIGNGVGARVTGSSNRIFHNHFTVNIQQALDPGVGNMWDDGYPSGGNWWSDYTGADLYHGPLQNLPGGDGIGDTPYVIDADSKDNYPFYYLPLPPPPRHVTARADGFPGSVTLEWEPPPLLANGRYLIYMASTPTGFDFTSPNATVDVPLTTWSDPGAAFTPGPKYYIVRALNLTSGATSPTSNTAGKWTHTFATGLSTFALPLSPYPWIDYSQPSWVDTVQDFLFNTGATSVAYMAAGRWVEVPGPGDPDHRLELGEGYAVRMTGPASYTFVGLPAAMISYMESPPLWYAGFGQDDARRIWATPFDTDVRISWVQPPGMMSMRDSYRVYYSPTRDGFFGVEGLDYFLLGGAPVVAPWGRVANAFHSGAFLSGREWYYMVVPYVNNSLQGSGSYSVGVFSEEIATGYSAVGLPLRPWANGTFTGMNVSFISSPDMLGVQWFDSVRNDWVARQAWMPPGMYDTPFDMVMAVQVDASVPTSIVFTGV